MCRNSDLNQHGAKMPPKSSQIEEIIDDAPGSPTATPPAVESTRESRPPAGWDTHRYAPGPNDPKLPPQLSEYSTATTDEFLKNMNKVPFFMRELDESGEDGGANDHLEALKALAYEGEPDEVATNFKNQGNEAYKEKRYGDALQFYDKALEVKCGVVAIDTACYINKAACNLELRNYRRCINDCKAALILDPKNQKAIFRSCTAFLAVGRAQEALELCDYAKSCEVFNDAMKNIETAAKKKLADNIAREKRELARKEIAEATEKNLELAIKVRKILQITTKAPPALPDGVPIHLEDPLDPTSTLLVPVLLLYPCDLQSDFLAEVDIGSTPGQALNTVFEHPPMWFSGDHVAQYDVKNLEVFVQTESGGLVKIGKKVSFESVLSAPKPKVPLIDNVITLHCVPKEKREQWLKTWSKDKAQKEMI